MDQHPWQLPDLASLDVAEGSICTVHVFTHTYPPLPAVAGSTTAVAEGEMHGQTATNSKMWLQEVVTGPNAEKTVNFTSRCGDSGFHGNWFWYAETGHLVLHFHCRGQGRPLRPSRFLMLSGGCIGANSQGNRLELVHLFSALSRGNVCVEGASW